MHELHMAPALAHKGIVVVVLSLRHRCVSARWQQRIWNRIILLRRMADCLHRSVVLSSNDNARCKMKLLCLCMRGSLLIYVVVVAVILLPLHIRWYEIEFSALTLTSFVFVDTVVVIDVDFVQCNGIKMMTVVLHTMAKKVSALMHNVYVKCWRKNWCLCQIMLTEGLIIPVWRGLWWDRKQNWGHWQHCCMAEYFRGYIFYVPWTT